jgi:hypothetical protein
MTIKEYQEMTGKRHKYGNHIVTDPETGEKFDSQKEWRRWNELKLLEKAGEISRLERQKKFELIPSFKTTSGKKERAMSYFADFYYYDMTDDRRHANQKYTRWVVEDVKSPITRKDKVYQIKRKLMAFLKGIEIKEI